MRRVGGWGAIALTVTCCAAASSLAEAGEQPAAPVAAPAAPAPAPVDPPAAPAPAAPVDPPAAPAPAAPADPPAAPVAAPAAPYVPDDGDGPVRLSLATESDAVAWTQSGFRLELGLAYGQIRGQGGAPDGRLLGPLLRLGARVSPEWSLLTTFVYESASAEGGLSGLRYGGTLEPTWHATANLELGLGLGFGGVVEGRTLRPDPDAAQRASLNNSYTFPDARPPLSSCSGVGAVAVFRARWAWLLGPRAQMGPTLEVFEQYTACIDDTGRVEPDTARPIVRRQWWPHLGGTLSWGFMWR